jgi:EAL domain.
MRVGGRDGELMNATAFGDRPQEIVTPERLLYDATERVGRIREGRLALHLHLSDLLAQNREDAKIRIAFRMFESMVDTFRGQLFLLTNSDIVLICKDARLADLDAIVYKLRALFSKDPLTYAESAEGRDRFVTYYDLELEYDSFFAVCAQLVESARKRLDAARGATPVQPLDARNLNRVIEAIAATDIAGVVRRQPCVRFTDKMIAEVAFQEFFMSIADLQKVLAPDVNILSNRWLFQHLSQVLDLRVLSVLQDAGLRKLPAAFSVNLNMATVETPVFQQFAESIRGKAGLVVEFQLMDIFNDLDHFFRARDLLRGQGHKTVLDGMSPITLQFMNAELYDTDFVKVNWSPDMADEVVTAGLHDALGPVGFDHVILARCDSEGAIAWGLGQGIRHFQGRFLDSMVSAVTMAQCDKASACTMAQCTQRHGVISGRTRAECGNHDMLDAFPPLKAFR